MTTNKISGTFDGGYYIARVATLRRDNRQSISPDDQLRVDVMCKRQTPVHGKFTSQFKTFRVNRTVRLQFSRFSEDLSRWLDSQETPLDVKGGTLKLVKTCYKSSRCFKLLKQITLTLEIGVTALETEETDGDDRECAVCLEGFSRGTHSRATKIACSHVFHGHCIAGWLQKHATCPLCRFEFKTHQIEDMHRRLGFSRMMLPAGELIG